MVSEEVMPVVHDFPSPFVVTSHELLSHIFLHGYNFINKHHVFKNFWKKNIIRGISNRSNCRCSPLLRNLVRDCIISESSAKAMHEDESRIYAVR